MITVTCDICSKVISSQEDSSTYRFVAWKMVKSVANPVPQERMFCSQHTEPMKKTLEEMEKRERQTLSEALNRKTIADK